MTNYPSIHQPWFILYKREPGQEEDYYTGDEDPARFYAKRKGAAAVFDNIHNAVRVAGALSFEGVMIRILVRKEEAHEFGRGEEGQL